MNENTSRTRLLVGLAVAAVLVVLSVIILNQFHTRNFAKLTVTLVPQDARLSLDNKTISGNKTVKIQPGNHTLKAQRSGFSTLTATFSVNKKQVISRDMYIDPINAEGYKWLEDHPEQAILYEAKSGKTYDTTVKNAISQQPFIQELPYIGAGFEFKIDYGSPQPNTSFPGQPVIYIAADTDEAKQDALTWIKNQGYEPTTMNIIYTASSSD